jgi:hypothetical protein
VSSAHSEAFVVVFGECFPDEFVLVVVEGVVLPLGGEPALQIFLDLQEVVVIVEVVLIGFVVCRLLDCELGCWLGVCLLVLVGERVGGFHFADLVEIVVQFRVVYFYDGGFRGSG